MYNDARDMLVYVITLYPTYWLVWTKRNAYNEMYSCNF